MPKKCKGNNGDNDRDRPMEIWQIEAGCHFWLVKTCKLTSAVFNLTAL